MTKLRKANAAEAEAGEKAAAERARRERKTGSVDRGPYVPSTPISRNEPSAPAGAEGLQGPQGVVAAPETVVSGSL